ncbi:DNA replication and repair protein RecF [bacterium]|nr:DNA replication and repair protein RecF [bacterium]
MVINSLYLKNYRNYNEFSVNFCPGINFIHGMNGQGKTNLVESLYYITHLRSFRTSKMEDLVSYNKDHSIISSILTKQEVSHEVGINIHNNHKKVIIDSKNVGLTSEYIKNFFSILFSPDQLAFFKEYPQERRNFFDRILLLFDQEYVQKIKEFNRIKKQKGILLRKGNAKDIHIWNKLLSSVIPKITISRKTIVEKINNTISSIFNNLTGRHEHLQVGYKSDFEERSVINESDIFDFLSQKMETELSKGYLYYGPHKDNFWMTLDEKRDKQSFSQGEYRISFLSLQLAINGIFSKILDFKPIILLDDIFSELDEEVFQKTIEFISRESNQVFITSTRIPNGLEDIGESFLINGGKLVY